MSGTILPVLKKHYGRLKNFIDGEWVESETDEWYTALNPATQEPIAEVPISTKEEMDYAIECAQEAYMEWRETPPQSRAQYMYDLKSLLEDNYESISRVVSQENGKLIDEARGSVRRTIENVEVACGVPSLMMGYNLEDGAAAGIDEEAIIQPLGVFGAISPFNFPAMVPFWFIPMALATGNTFVLKPSKYTAVSQMHMFEMLEEADLPPGIVNMVYSGRDGINAMLDNPMVQGVSFVGSSKVGRIIYDKAARNQKRVQCQTAAKNCITVMPDADLDKGIPNMLGSFYGCAGQRCLAGSVLVPVGDIYEEVRNRFCEGARNLKVGYGLDESSQMGPVITPEEKQRILNMIQKGIDEGAELVVDGRDVAVEGYEEGNFIGPCVFDKVTTDMTPFKEEFFGPVASIVRADSLQEAIDIQNSLPYGNASSIFTSSGKAARDYKYYVEAGNIGVNVAVAAAMAYFPFGGYKDSFYGDLHGQGKDGLMFYTERKVVINRWF